MELALLVLVLFTVFVAIAVLSMDVREGQGGINPFWFLMRMTAGLFRGFSHHVHVSDLHHDGGQVHHDSSSDWSCDGGDSYCDSVDSSCDSGDSSSDSGSE